MNPQAIVVPGEETAGDLEHETHEAQHAAEETAERVEEAAAETREDIRHNAVMDSLRDLHTKVDELHARHERTNAHLEEVLRQEDDEPAEEAAEAAKEGAAEAVEEAEGAPADVVEEIEPAKVEKEEPKKDDGRRRYHFGKKR